MFTRTHSWIRERPLLQPASCVLTDAELLALIVRSGARGRSALEVSGELLAEHRGISGLASADLATLARRPALGQAKASSLVAAFELGRRAAAAEEAVPACVRGAADIAVVARRALIDPSREEVVVLVLNRSNKVKRVENLTLGTDSRCLLDVRDVLSVVLKHGGSAFAVVHSHPTGEVEPSPEDIRITRELYGAARATGVRFLDHVIVAGSRWAAIDKA